MQQDSGKNRGKTINKGLIVSIVAFAALAMMVLAVVSVDNNNSTGQNDVQKTIDIYSGTCGDGLTFTFDEVTGKLTIVKSGPGTGAIVDKNQPWNGYRHAIKEVVMEEGVTYIGKDAFSDCTSLKKVVMSSVKVIDVNAFFGCKSLKSIEIPGSVMTLRNNAFGCCTSLETVKLAKGLTFIRESAFSGCTSLRLIDIPCTVRCLEKNAFSGCTSLCNIRMGYDITGISAEAFPDHRFETYDKKPVGPLNKNFTGHRYIGTSTNEMVAQNEFGKCGDGVEYCFRYSTGEMRIDSCDGSKAMYNYKEKDRPWESIKGLIKSVKITGVINTGFKAFAGCSSLESVEMSCNDAVSIGKYSFDGCTSLKYVKLPDSIKRIGESAFNGCSSLESIDLPSNLCTIVSCAFKDCTSLKSITIPGSVEFIGSDAFRGCTSLKSVDMSCGVKDLSCCIFRDCTSLEAVRLPRELKYIRDSAFRDCTSLKLVAIPGNVEFIESNAFKDCKSLKSIAIPGSVKHIGSDAFERCTSLCNIKVGCGVEGVDVDAFPNHKFQMHNGTPIAPKDKNFSWHKYKGETIDKMVAQDENGWCGDRVAFHFRYSTGEMRIDSCGGSREMYDFASGYRKWEPIRDLIRSVKIIDIKNIGNYAFADCKSLVSVEMLCDDAMSIGKNSFDNCKSLKYVKLPNSIERIGSDAFIGCESLETIDLPSNLRIVNNHAFSGCTSLKSITMPDEVEFIGYDAFSGCTSLKSITIPSKVGYIGSNAFSGCTSLCEINVERGVKEIAANAFPDHKFQKYDGTSIAPSDKYFPGHEYKGTSTDKMVVQDENGWCGDGLKFHFYYPTGELTISRYGGKGQMDKYSSADAVPWSAFRNEIKSINVCEGVQSIGSRAFAKCASLESVKLPESIKVIGAFAFSECTSLPSIVIPKNVSVKHLVFCDCLKLTDVTFMDGIKEIGSGVFKGCISLKNVKIPDSMRFIGDCAFLNCKALDAIQIPNGVKCIGIGAFSGCISLKSVSLPDDVKIGSKAFDNCKSLLEISVGKNDGTEKIASDAFPSHKFFLADGGEVRPGDAEFAGHTYRGSTVDKMVAAEPVDSESLNVCSAADHFDQSRFFCPIRSA